jgi:hypothetical protein
LKQSRAELGNDIATEAFREGRLPFPGWLNHRGAALERASSNADNKVFAEGFPGAGLETTFAGTAVSVQFMVKDSNTLRPVAGDLPTSRTASLETRRSVRRASPATSLRKITTLSLVATQ